MTFRKPTLIEVLTAAAIVFFIGSCAQLTDEGDETAQLKSAKSLDKEVHQVVEELPLFGGCETKVCSDNKLMEYIYQNMKYPKDALEEGVEGKTFITFVINADGTVSDEQVARADHESFGKAALAIVSDMNKLDVGWTPGRDEGKEVAVEYRLPVVFKLEG